MSPTTTTKKKKNAVFCHSVRRKKEKKSEGRKFSSVAFSFAFNTHQSSINISTFCKSRNLFSLLLLELKMKALSRFCFTRSVAVPVRSLSASLPAAFFSRSRFFFPLPTSNFLPASLRHFSVSSDQQHQSSSSPPSASPSLSSDSKVPESPPSSTIQEMFACSIFFISILSSFCLYFSFFIRTRFAIQVLEKGIERDRLVVKLTEENLKKDQQIRRAQGGSAPSGPTHVSLSLLFSCFLFLIPLLLLLAKTSA